MERFMKQNHDLEEQLCQRDAGHDVQEEKHGETSKRKSMVKVPNEGDLKGQRAVTSPADPNDGT